MQSRLYNKQYDPSKLPLTHQLQKSKGGKSLDWLHIKPDPPAMPKILLHNDITITSSKDANTSAVFCEIFRPKPLYEHVQQISESGQMSTVNKNWNKILPPVAYDHHGKYKPRDLTPEELQQILKLNSEDRIKYRPSRLGLKFKCSKEQVAKIIQAHRMSFNKPHSRRWKWYYGKKYASFRVESS
ncbi:hypothetical protein MIR68_004208 [Amoeboaphelidium protococcarum]|nr:hypothetical protein MIR68_004208 [Amoeboaphelidium protococcarum]